MLASVLIMRGNDYVWYVNWSESLLLLHALKHDLWAMSKTNSSDYIGVCVVGGQGGDRGGNVGVQCRPEGTGSRNDIILTSI